MHDFDPFDEDIDEEYGLYDGQCQACDLWGRVDDLGLCSDCREKLERDLIRQRDWAYSAWAFEVPDEKWEGLRQQVIKKYGEKLELIVSKGSNRRARKRWKKKPHA